MAGQRHDVDHSCSQLLEVEKSMIVGICGAPGAGKGEAAKVLMELGYENGKFSHALKHMFRALLVYRGAVDPNRYIEGDLKEIPTPLLNGKSPRHAMQTLGAWGRNDIDKKLWVDTEFEVLEDEPKLVFDDVRDDIEEMAIRNRGGFIIHLKGRDGIESDHYLEKFVPKVATVIDNSGTLDELRAKVEQFAIDLTWVDLS
jgi:hypothetical protein